jgi:DNA-binding response OmpR family regulator
VSTFNVKSLLVASPACRKVEGKAVAATKNPVASSFDIMETESAFMSLPPEPPALILSVSPSQNDHAALQRILRDCGCRLATAQTCGEALEALYSSRYLLVFCECSLPDGGWKDILDLINHLEMPPLLVVTSHLADERLWAEVLNLGGYDVLSKPLIENEVRHVVDLALAHQSHAARRQRVLRTTC